MEKTVGEMGRPFAVDQNLPRWLCQNCHHSLYLAGADSYVDKFLPDSSSCFGMDVSSIHGAGSALGSKIHMDNSFVLLPKQGLQSQGLPSHLHGGGPSLPDPGPSRRVMDESFVIVYKNESVSDGGAGHLSTHPAPHGVPLTPNNFGFNANITVLKRAFEIATTQAQVEQPLCLECMRVLSDKLNKEVEDVNKDIEAYEACYHQMKVESCNVLSEAEFLKEKLKFEEEERILEALIEETEKEHSKITAEFKELEIKSCHFKELEERYWYEINNFQFQLISHQEESDAILAKTEVSQAHLDLLKQTNVLTDAFPIWHDQDFGTINNFRLGRLPNIHFEWDEINAAWGQACLLLHTMCQHFRPRFPYRIKILPMGSYPKIVDLSNNTYELFGPVDLFWSTRYDRAMTLYLACLKDFADFANSNDRENNILPEKCFKLPYKIEDDKVHGYSITQSFSKQENWTRALKYTINNLKWALHWFMGNTKFQPLSSTASQLSYPATTRTTMCIKPRTWNYS
ncbi:hypothetical protein SAY86_000383 [Trapa natans]|uniref:Beclin-1-like protein n=1 Tax=Trapa natans TaxID=22666 RepID=A0AAN7MU93_TRANT|nr:hypothetical protein SAY86_000383 [Trapa natans]